MGDPVVTEPTVTDQRNGLPPDTVIDEKPPVPENEGLTESLFGESVTEAELRGEEPPPKDEGTLPPPTGDEPPKYTPPPKEGEQPPAKEPPATEGPKPPPGHVPIGALHEERGKRQAMSARLAELEAENAALKEGKATPPPVQEPPAASSQVPEGFKVLTPEEFKTLAETDVVEAQIYQYNLNLYKEEQSAKTDQATKTKQIQEQTSQIIERRYAEMDETVPGIFDENSTVNQELTEFAQSQGMDTDVLGILTDPGTRIVQPDGRVVILGKGAVQVLKMVHGYQQAIKPDPSKETKIKQEATAQVIKKIQETSGGYRNIGDTPPGGSSIPDDLSKPMSEAEFAKLSPAEQERYLRGA